MKNTLNILLLMIGMIISHITLSQTYTVIYFGGMDTLRVSVGENITKSLAFHESYDQFSRGEPDSTGIVSLSSHGFTFFVDHPKFSEDTLEGMVILFGGTFVRPKQSLVAMRDNRTGGDMYDPDEAKKSLIISDDLSSFPWFLFSGIALFVLYGIFRWRPWV